MSAQLDQIDAEIAMWQRQHDRWLLWNGIAAYREAHACRVEIDKLRRERLALTERK